MAIKTRASVQATSPVLMAIKVAMDLNSVVSSGVEKFICERTPRSDCSETMQFSSTSTMPMPPPIHHRARSKPCNPLRIPAMVTRKMATDKSNDKHGKR